MTYTVVWQLTAVRQLNDLIAAGSDPDRIRRAAAFVDYLLRRMPLDLGESRGGTYRLWYEDALGVFFSVDTDAMSVRVLLVGPSRRH